MQLGHTLAAGENKDLWDSHVLQVFLMHILAGDPALVVRKGKGREQV